jgi:hypothetical protein
MNPDADRRSASLCVGLSAYATLSSKELMIFMGTSPLRPSAMRSAVFRDGEIPDVRGQAVPRHTRNSTPHNSWSTQATTS